MPQFSNLNDLVKYLKTQAKEAMAVTGEYIKDAIKEEIDQDVYSFTPSMYKRSFDLRESVVSEQPTETGNEISVLIHHDPSLMHDHYSAVTGEDLSAMIPYYVDEGKAGHIYGEGFWTEKRDYMGNAMNKLESSKSYLKVIKDSLKLKGVDIQP